MMNVMLLSFGLSNNIRGKHAQSTYFILKRVPHKRLEKTP